MKLNPLHKITHNLTQKYPIKKKKKKKHMGWNFF